MSEITIVKIILCIIIWEVGHYTLMEIFHEQLKEDLKEVFEKSKFQMIIFWSPIIIKSTILLPYIIIKLRPAIKKWFEEKSGWRKKY